MRENLATKYRPKVFADVVGQENIKIILNSQIATREFKQAYLFTGGAGTGKTTSARIMATEINLGKGQPIEIDGASNNGVENVRGVIESCKFRAMDSEYKIYIIDEVHMLSIGAFNALLKTLEEPPAGTIFILCTTDPQKIPATIMSRVQKFDFKRIETRLIIKRLEEICVAEEMAVTLETLAYLAKLANGGLRDAITLLDTCHIRTGMLTMDVAIERLGAVAYDIYFELTDFILQNNAVDALILVDEQYNSGRDLKQFIKGYILFVLDVLKYKLLQDFSFVSIPESYEIKLEEWEKSNIQVAFLQELLRTFIELSARVKWESNVKPLLESEVLLLCL